MSKMKVFLYYLKSTGGLYAFTEESTIANEFEIERSMRLYKKKKVKMSEPEFKAFIYNNREKMLFVNVLNDEEHDITFVTTYSENSELEYICSTINHTMEDMSVKVYKFPLKKEVEKLFDDIFDYYGDGIDESILNFDTFKIFMNLYRENIL